MWDNTEDAYGQGARVDTVELVGGGLAEWPPGKGPRGETIAPAAFVDVTGAEHLLELPRHFHAAESKAGRRLPVGSGSR
jgi:hypothetical protein